MKKSYIVLVFTISAFFLSTASAKCHRDKCLVFALDSSRGPAVYDHRRFLLGETNADAVKEILGNGLPNIEVRIGTTGNPDTLDVLYRVAGSYSDLIILHTSAFYSDFGLQATVKGFIESVHFLAQRTDAKILVYGSHYEPVGGISNFKNYIVRHTAVETSQIFLIEVPRTFDSKTTQYRILGFVKQILGIR